ncbi:unnamed protein product, partial [Ectocarpus sp. 8 AP-2014]
GNRSEPKQKAHVRTGGTPKQASRRLGRPSSTNAVASTTGRSNTHGTFTKRNNIKRNFLHRQVHRTGLSGFPAEISNMASNELPKTLALPTTAESQPMSSP